MSLEAQEVAVRVRLLGGSAFKTEADEIAGSIEKIDEAGARSGRKGIGPTLTDTSKKLKSAGSAMTSFGAGMVSTGRSLTMLGIPLAAVGYYSVKTAASFGQSMTLLQTQAGASAKEVKSLTDQVKGMPEKFGTTPTAIAEALYPIESVGLRGKKAVDALRASLYGTAVGLDSLENTTDAVTTIMSTHIRGVHGPVQAMATMDAAIGQGKMHLQDMTESFKSGIVPLSQAYGLSFQQIIAAEAAATREGIPANQVMNRMRLTLSSLVAPTKAGQDALSSMGLTQFALADDLRKPGGLLTALEDLHEHSLTLDKNHRNAAISEIFGRSRGAGQIATLLSALPQMKKIYATVMGADQRTLMAHFAETTHTAAFRFKQLKGAVDQAMLSLGNAIMPNLIPVLHTLVGMVTGFVHWFDKLSPSTRNFIVKAAALTIILGPLLIVFGSIFKVIGTLLTGFGLLTGAMAGEGVAAGGLAGILTLDLGAAFTGLWALMIANPFVMVGLAIAILLIKFKGLQGTVNMMISGWRDLLDLGKQLLGLGDGPHRTIAPNRLAHQMDINNARLRVQHQMRRGQRGAMNPHDIAFLEKNVKGFDLGRLYRNTTARHRHHHSAGLFGSNGVIAKAGAELQGLPGGHQTSPMPHLTGSTHQAEMAFGNLGGFGGQHSDVIHVPVYLDGVKIADAVNKVNRQRANRR